MGKLYITTKKGGKPKPMKFGTSQEGVARAALDARAKASRTGFAEVTRTAKGRERVIVCEKKRKVGRYMRMVSCKFTAAYLPGEGPKSMPANKRSKGRKSNRKVKRRRYKASGRKGATLRRGGKGKRMKAKRGRARGAKGRFVSQNYRR